MQEDLFHHPKIAILAQTYEKTIIELPSEKYLRGRYKEIEVQYRVTETKSSYEINYKGLMVFVMPDETLSQGVWLFDSNSRSIDGFVLDQHYNYKQKPSIAQPIIFDKDELKRLGKSQFKFGYAMSILYAMNDVGGAISTELKQLNQDTEAYKSKASNLLN